MTSQKSSKMLQFINYRMKVNVSEDNRTLVGTLLAFDKHMNLVLSETQEYRKIRRKRGELEIEEREEMRSLGLVLLRGESVVSIQVEAPPKKKAKPAIAAGRGVPVGRGEGVVTSHSTGQPVLSGLQAMFPPPNLAAHAGRGR
jgi:small nuclear ribonucleoprotein B and B'